MIGEFRSERGSVESWVWLYLHLVCLVCRALAQLLSKGNRVNIPEPARGDWFYLFGGGIQRGNATELGDTGVGHGKSYLFFVRNGLPGIGLSGDRDVVSVKHRGSCGVRCTSVGP